MTKSQAFDNIIEAVEAGLTAQQLKNRVCAIVTNYHKNMEGGDTTTFHKCGNYEKFLDELIDRTGLPAEIIIDLALTCWNERHIPKNGILRRTIGKKIADLHIAASKIDTSSDARVNEFCDMIDKWKTI